MKPKEKRDRLFKQGRPNIRPLELYNGSQYGRDMGILWAAYTLGSFSDRLPEGMSQEEFAKLFLEISDGYSLGWAIEDNNIKFNDQKGVVGVMMAVYNGWELEPHFEPFPWATPRNILKAVVSFLQMMRYDKSIGIVNVYSLEKHKNFFKHVADYGVLRYVDRIPHGDISGDRYIFYVRGRKDVRNSQQLAG